MHDNAIYEPGCNDDMLTRAGPRVHHKHPSVGRGGKIFIAENVLKRFVFTYILLKIQRKIINEVSQKLLDIKIFNFLLERN